MQPPKNIVIHSYKNAEMHLMEFVNLPVVTHPPNKKVVFDKNSIHYWFCDLVYFRNTKAGNVIPPGFLDTPNTFMVIELDIEPVNVVESVTVKLCIDIITRCIPKERIILIAGNEQQLIYILNHYPMLRENAMLFNFWEIWSRAHIRKLQPDQNSRRRFLYINRRNHKHRTYAFSLLWKSQEFKSHSYASFNPGNYWNEEAEIDNPNYIKNILQECFSGIEKTDKDIESWFLSQELPQLPSKYSVQDPYQYDMGGVGLMQAHTDTDISMIVESVVQPIAQRFFPTEKIFRAIGMSQPFIVYGQLYYYSHLSAMGYRSYETEFGEVHDTIEDDFARGRSFANTVIELAEQDDARFSEILNSVKNIRKHNYKNFMVRTSLNAIGDSFSEAMRPLVPYLTYKKLV